eukprot:gb/GEZN01016304.1/.p1 GENE.gb/GEZN01016304.1/~~gb/GEZN01016304.1/.p1  ORF type:complete len:168 (+),score=2.99 gb/GEZN01016304.1/:91-594(+)
MNPISSVVQLLSTPMSVVMPPPRKACRSFSIPASFHSMAHSPVLRLPTVLPPASAIRSSSTAIRSSSNDSSNDSISSDNSSSWLKSRATLPMRGLMHVESMESLSDLMEATHCERTDMQRTDSHGDFDDTFSYVAWAQQSPYMTCRCRLLKEDSNQCYILHGDFSPR